MFRLAMQRGEDDDTAPAMAAAILTMETLFSVHEELTAIRKMFGAVIKALSR